MNSPARGAILCVALLAIGATCPTQPSNDNSSSLELAAALDIQATHIALRSPDSALYAIVLWQRAANLYRNGGDPMRASVALQEIAITYKATGELRREREYLALSSSYVSMAAYTSEPRATVIGTNLIGTDYSLAESSDRRTAELLMEVARHHAERGEIDSALAYIGGAYSVTDASKIQKAKALLALTPITADGASITTRTGFVDRTVALLDDATARSGVQVTAATDRDATARLEALLAHEEVKVSVRSVPTSVKVKYWPLVGDSAHSSDVTTNDSLLVRPATYVFSAADPVSKRVTELTTRCAIGCRVLFDFSIRH